MIKKKISQDGFTLLETLVVITIIGILAAVVTVSYSSVQASARDSVRLSDLEQIRLALNLYKQDFGSLPSGNGVLLCSNTSVCDSINETSQILLDFGLEIGDTERFIYMYSSSEPCNEDYTVSTLRAVVEVGGNDNTAEQTALCSELPTSQDDNEHILFLEYFE